MARDKTDRYRQAAEAALGQLDWCIGYLHGIHKERISAQLAKKRAYIRRALLRGSGAAAIGGDAWIVIGHPSVPERS